MPAPLSLRLLPLLSAYLMAFVSVASAATDVCTALPFKTLSYSCNGVCPTTNHTCIAYDASEPTPCDLVGASPKSSCVTPSTTLTNGVPASCIYQCFAPYEDATDMRFYVLFNTTRRTRAPSVTTAAPVGNATTAKFPPYESNDFVRRLGVLELPRHIVKVVISGGRNEDSAPRGDVVDLEIDPAAFSKTPNLTLIGLLNVDLGRRLPDFPMILPKDVPAVDVTNTNLKEIPTSMNRLAKLDSISFQRNQLIEVPVWLEMPQIKMLFLGENLLTTFNSSFLSLEFLDLADNKLRAFPTVVFNMTKLSTLKLAQNPDMAKVMFTTRQFEQLSAFEEFSIDDDVLDNSSCKAEQLQKLKYQTSSVCVVSDDELAGSAGKTDSNDPTSEGGLSSTVLAVILVLVATVALVSAFAIYKYFKKRQVPSDDDVSNRRFRLAKMDDPSAGTTGDGASGSRGSGPSKKARHALLLSEGSVLSSGQSLWDDDEMLSRQLQLEDIEDLRVIGSGGFAIVWLVRYLPQNRLLASKRLIKDQVTRQKTMDFVMEIKLNMQLDHPNIVQLVGVAWTIETDLQALLEYLPNGDLRSHLETTAPTASSPPPPWDAQKLQLAIDIVEALVYVHSFSPPLVHRDLKSRNVLLTDAMKAKLCDFGVSRFASENNTMTTAVGTGKWLAPEVVAGSNSYNESCDIYSFGVVMSELDTHRLPYDDVMGPQGHRLPEVAVLQMVSSGQIQPTLSAACPDEIRRVILQCLTFMPAERPTAMEVAYALRLVARTFNGLM